MLQHRTRVIATDRRGEGGEWGIIRNIFLLLVIIVIMIYLLQHFVLDTVRDQNDCEREEGASCALVCGPDQEQIPKQCDQKENPGAVCCQDTEYIFNMSEA